MVSIRPSLDLSDKRELGSDAVFTISSAKPGNGVEQLRDGNLDTYWQSDGLAPHFINVQFTKKVSISQISFYCDYTLDESYTAKRVCIRSGTSVHDLVDIATIDVNDPKGWVTIDVCDDAFAGAADAKGPLRTHMIQLRVLAMVQNGRDTHIRQLKILGPRSSPVLMAETRLDSFKSTEMLQFSTLR